MDVEANTGQMLNGVFKRLQHHSTFLRTKEMYFLPSVNVNRTCGVQAGHKPKNIALQAFPVTKKQVKIRQMQYLSPVIENKQKILGQRFLNEVKATRKKNKEQAKIHYSLVLPPGYKSDGGV